MISSPNSSNKYLGTYHMASTNNSDYSFEPQRTNNFEVMITGLDNTITANGQTIGNASEIITLSVASYSAPQINISPIVVPYGNNKVKFAGTPEFPDSNIVLNDYIGLNVERILQGWQKKVYNPDTQVIGYASQYKKEGYLIEYDPSGNNPRQWKLIGCWPSQLQLGDFNQEGNSVRQVIMTLTYDYAIPIDTASSINRNATNYADRTSSNF